MEEAQPIVGTPIPDAAHGRVLAAQLAVPTMPDWYVPRARLLDFLDTSAGKPLVLVSAPAGSGKTALVAEWVRRRLSEDVTVWVTAKEADEGLGSLLDQALSHNGVRADGMRSSRQGAAPSCVSAATVAIANSPRRVTAVLDGFELAATAAADEVQALLDLAGDGLRLVIVSRVDPVLPLYRYRLSDAIVEVRADDLAFTAAEVRALFAPLGVGLEDQEVDQVIAQTGGWAAGLRFAARAVEHAGTCGSALAAMESATGDINEYLLGEVLDTQPADVRDFLLYTSIPDVMYEGLVDALVGHVPLRTIYDLTKINAFVEPTDQVDGSFRYQPFFRDLLRAQLAYEAPETFANLQRRTGVWYLRQGLLKEGLPYLTASHAWDLVAAAVVDTGVFVDLLLDGEHGPLATLLRELPDDVDEPAACLVRATLAWISGDGERCARELEPLHLSRRVSGDPAIHTAAVVLEALRGRVAEPPDKAVRLAERAEARIAELGLRSSETPTDLGALVCTTKGIAVLRAGNLAGARHAFAAGLASGPHAHPAVRAEALGYLAIVDAVAGRLNQAERSATQSLVLADSLPPWAPRPAAADVALGWVALDRYDLDHARDHLARAGRSSNVQRDPLCRTLRTIAVAGLLRGRGRVGAALSKIRVGLTEVDWHDQWLADRLRLEGARLLVAAGESKTALHELSSVTEQTDAKVVASLAHLARGEDSAAADCLVGVQRGGAPLGLTVTCLLADAARHSGQKSPARARQALDRGLRLAAREQLRRPFHEALPPVQRMLAHDPHLADAGRWVRHGCEPESLRTRRGTMVAGPIALVPPAPAQAVDSLTAREMEVLRHLANLLSTEEIAAEMFVSVNTVRTHVRSILRKLRVPRRNAAVRRARALGLLER